MNIERIQTGDVAMCTSNSLLGKLIMWFTRSRFSHAALFVWIDERLFVIDAQKDGVNLRPFSAWNEKYKYQVTILRSPEKLIPIHLKNRAMTKIGTTAYDFVGLILRSPIELITGKWKKDPNPEKKMYCSEYVAWVYKIEESYRMSPEDLYWYMIKNNFYIVPTNF